MPQCVVIADDLTGGNATGVQLRQSNFTSMSILTEDALETAAHADSDCVIYPTKLPRCASGGGLPPRVQRHAETHVP